MSHKSMAIHPCKLLQFMYILTVNLYFYSNILSKQFNLTFTPSEKSIFTQLRHSVARGRRAYTPKPLALGDILSRAKIDQSSLPLAMRWWPLSASSSFFTLPCRLQFPSWILKTHWQHRNHVYRLLQQRVIRITLNVKSILQKWIDLPRGKTCKTNNTTQYNIYKTWVSTKIKDKLLTISTSGVLCLCSLLSETFGCSCVFQIWGHGTKDGHFECSPISNELRFKKRKPQKGLKPMQSKKDMIGLQGQAPWFSGRYLLG